MRIPSLGASSAISALRHDQYRLLFGGLAASNLGIWMQQFALGWLVVQIAVNEGNPELGPLYLGLRSLASAIPALGFGLFAGVFADRMDRRDLLVRARIASSLIAIVLAAIVFSGRANIWSVMALSAAAAAAFSFDPPGRFAIVPKIVPPKDLFSAMGLTRAAMQAAHTIGPLIAGVLVIPIGVGGVLLAKAGLDVVSIGALTRMAAQPVEASARALGVLGSMREGLGHVLGTPLLRWLAVLQIVAALFAHSFMQLLPAVAVDTLRVGAVELSWLVAASGIGSLVGAFALASLQSVRPRGLLLLGLVLSVGLALILLGLQRELLGALLVLVGLGLLQQLYMGTQSVILQLAAPDRLRGRVMGMQPLIFMTLSPVGVFVVGALGTFIGISSAIALSGILVTVAALATAAKVSVVRDLRSDPEPRARQDLYPDSQAAEASD